MKTAAQWYRENYTSGEWSNWWNITPPQIRAIQLDAFKAGMTKAAEICDNRIHPTASHAAQAILTARDTLTKLP